ncbi:MAG: addiction module toxin RelE [Candidatus ainarchaeum sp.]|nr:addiction module toxin RelE [Candidatus ainarchaeum sp.]
MLNYDVHPHLRKILQKLKTKDKIRLKIIKNKMDEIISSTEETIENYKPLRYNLKNQKRVHIDKSFVLVFSYDKKEKLITFLDFDHHDNIYK